MTTAPERADLRVRPVRKHNPGLHQSDAEVIRQFVVRGRELDTVLDVLREDLDATSCQHVLIVAPRGRGKTMLLERVAAELRTDGELAGRLLPVQFMEESYEVFDAASFWLDALFHLAREMDVRDPEFARELRETHAGLTGRWREDALEGFARTAVLEAAERLDAKLVLMVENLQALPGGQEHDFGWKLREALQSEPRIILLATATSRFQELEDARAPFFDLFRTVSLEPLSTDECRRLWQEISGERLDGREVRPLEILTGGSPRLLVILAGLARHVSFSELMERLVVLIDDYTEYFRSQLEGLPGVERRVFLAVADLWRPSGTGEIAARARLDVRTASTMLGRLVERGAVVAEGSGKRRLYASAERLFSIYYKLRRERDEAAVVHGVIRYLALFYTRDEMAEKHLGDLDASLANWNEVVERFGAGDVPETQNVVVAALELKALGEAEAGRAAEVLRVCDQLEARLDWLSGDRKAEITWTAESLRAKALLRLDTPEAALAAFRVAYEAFVPDNANMMRGIQTLVPDLVAGGVPAAALTEVLEGHRGKADALRPLVAALRLEAGETVREPFEVVEIARDIRERIAAKAGVRAGGGPVEETGGAAPRPE